MTKKELLIEAKVVKQFIPKDSKDELYNKLLNIYTKEFKVDFSELENEVPKKTRRKSNLYRSAMCRHLRILGFSFQEIASKINTKHSTVIYHDRAFQNYLDVQDCEAVEIHYIFLNYLKY
jgi:hypothetical protein